MNFAVRRLQGRNPTKDFASTALGEESTWNQFRTASESLRDMERLVSLCCAVPGIAWHADTKEDGRWEGTLCKEAHVSTEDSLNV